jgi:hypothetical protein
MGLLMAQCAEDDQILGSVIAQSAPPLNVMDLKIFYPPERLTTPYSPRQTQHHSETIYVTFLT